MARATVFPSTPPARAAVAPTTSKRRPLRVVVGKVFAQLDGETERDDSLWYLNIGATNHMTGCQDAFIHMTW